MKKVFSSMIALLIFLLAYQFFVTFLISKKNYNYSILTSDNNYLINENFQRKKGVNSYSFLITDKENNSFVYSYNGNLNRQSRIIKNIASYKNNELYCIAPVFNDDSIENIVCKYQKQLVGYNYLKQIGNYDVDSFINNLESLEYRVNLDFKDINSAKTAYRNISYYNDIDPNLYFTVWNYRGVYLINNNNVVEEQLLNNDLYENKYSIISNEHFILANPDENFDSFLVVNVKEKGQDKIESKDDISSTVYFNGSYKGKVYLTDVINKKQYILDPKRETINLLDKPKYYNGEKLIDIDISELVTEQKYFSSYVIPDEILNKYGNDILYSEGNYYYQKNGEVYKIVGDNYDYSVLLFKFDDLKELKVLNGNLYFISYDTIYMYNDKIGLKKVIEDRELIYNYKNIYNVYEK